MTAKTRSILSLSLGVILLASMTGCGGEESEPIKIGISAWAGVEPAELAFRAGYYAKRGVAIEMVRFSAYTDSIEAFIEGRVDVDMQTFDDAIRLAASGRKMKVVLFTDHSYGGDGIVARADISSVADLRGQTVGVETGTVGHFSLLKALDDAGLDEADITIVSIPAWEIKEAFVAGEIDAGVTWEPYLTSSAEEANGNVIITSRSYPNQIVTTMVVSDQLIATRRPAVQSLVAAYFDAVEHIVEKPTEAYAMMAAAEGISPEEFARHVDGLRYLDLGANKVAFDPAQDGELYSHGRSLSAFLASKGVIKSEPDIDNLLLGAFLWDLQ